jgi:hypothetical protein
MSFKHRSSSPDSAFAARSVVAFAVLLACASAPAAASTKPASAKPVAATAAVGTAVHLSADARALADWVIAANDSKGRPFLIVDKRQATVSAFDAAGRPLASAPALLGLARGDDSVPGIGERKISDIQPHERTTPAGRFAAELGNNSAGEDILWVDYDAAVSMHRVRPVKASERRLERLASASPDDNRISYGCINVPAAFYDGYVKPLFLPKNGIVYVLPDTKPMAAVFGPAMARTTARSTVHP